MSTRADYKRRVVAIYQAYAPNKVSSADSNLDKYQGQEDALIEVLVSKYGPEPHSAPAGGGGSSSMTPGRGGGPQSFHEPGPPPKTDSMYAFDQQFSQVFGSPPQQTPQQSTTFDTNMQGMGQQQHSQVFAPTTQQQHQQQPGMEEDEFADIRKIVKETQFATAEHERMWEEAWMGKIPLGTVQKYVGGGQAALMEGWGHKSLSRPKVAILRKFVKRYFLLLPFFLYYFETDDEKSYCRGALYMEGATVGEIETEGKNCIEITSRVNHKPAQLDPNGNYSSFKIYFDSSRAQARWFQILQEMTKVKPKPKAQPGTNTIVVHTQQPGGGMVMQTPQQQQQQQQQQVGGQQQRSGAGTPMQQQGAPHMPPLSPPVAGGGGTGSERGDTPTGPTTIQPGSGTPREGGLAAGVGQTTGTILVSEDNVKNRIKRLAKVPRNDPMTVIEKLTDFVCKARPSADQQELWELMEELETVNDQTVAREREENTELIELRVQAASMQKKLDEQNEIISQLQGGPTVAALANVSNMAANTSGSQQQQQRSPVRVIHGDSAWQERMTRIQARKTLVEQMLNDLPA